MNKCKIEVLKTTLDEELAKEYGCKGFGKCPMHKVGDIFYNIQTRKPYETVLLLYTNIIASRIYPEY